jgi:hypothetical protein
MSVRAELWVKQMSRAPVRPYPRSIYLNEGTLCLAEPLPAVICPFTVAGSRILNAALTAIAVFCSPLVLPRCFLE